MKIEIEFLEELPLNKPQYYRIKSISKHSEWESQKDRFYGSIFTIQSTTMWKGPWFYGRLKIVKFGKGIREWKNSPSSLRYEVNVHGVLLEKLPKPVPHDE